jgi:hypothetical protein
LLERLKQNLEARAFTSMVVAPVFVLVIAFLGVACFLALQEILAPAMAALVTAAAGAMLIIVLLLVMRLVIARRQSRSSRDAPSGSGQPIHLDALIEGMLQDHADPVLRRGIRDNPDRAMAATLMLGVAAGYSDSVQRALLDLYRHYAAAETARRGADPEPEDPRT